jgi:hypothetical protein
MKMINDDDYENNLEILYNNKYFLHVVSNVDEAYKIVSNLLNDPNIDENELNDLAVYYNGEEGVIEMVE